MPSKKPKPLPLYLRRAPKRDAYIFASEILDAVAGLQCSRVVKYNGNTRSAQQCGGGWLKPINNFHPVHCGTEETWYAFLEECAARGVRMPSSYADVFIKLLSPPRIKWSVNRLFLPVFCGPWEEARQTGLLPGFWRQYDLNRAYLWATSLGLPDPLTFTKTDRIVSQFPGVYHLEITNARDDLPHPYNENGWVMATDAEIETYGLQVKKVRRGYFWKRRLPGDTCAAIMQSLSFGDHIAKSFWGLWAARNPIQTEFPQTDKVTRGRSIYLNLIWAHHVISSIKMRVWEDGGDSAHVFCDSIITRKRLETSTRVGGWKLVTEFPSGVYVEGAGRYGYAADKLLKHAGTPAPRDKWSMTQPETPF